MDDNKNDIKKRLEELRNENNKRNKRPNNGKPPFSLLLFVLIVLTGLFFMRDPRSYFQTKKEISYSEFVAKIRNEEFSVIKEKDDEITSEIKENGKDIVYSTRKTTDRIGEDPIITDILKNKKVKLEVEKPSSKGVLIYILLNVLPLVLMMGLIFYLGRRMMENSQGGPGNIFGFGKSRSEKLEKKPDVRFDDVAGVDGAKEELKEVVDFLKNPSKYTKAGARVPKGVLLLGRPGTGKTLLAKAVAGESGASFFSISGSEFVEMFVGVGASRVRDLFEKAKKSSPSIIFIDEIDAIGRRRGMGKNSGSNDEREQTLNQLLVEMDGFETDTKVIVIAATNREDVLDPALLRAGRFDRRVSVDAPDMQGRVAILKVHAKNKKLSKNVRLEDIAKITPGFVGADLANLLNEAAILAARRGSDTITMEDLDEAVDKIGMGLGQKGKIIKPEEKRLLAYHEAGHAVMTELTEGADPVHKVTIIPRGTAGGFMMPLPEEKLVLTRKELLAEIKVLFAGRAAEELVLDDISTGASNDIERATQIARIYVERVGMSRRMGPVNLANSEDEFSFIQNKSNETIREIDLEMRKILIDEYNSTLATLKENRDTLEGVAQLLLKKETITGDEVRKIISGKTVEEVLMEDDRKDEAAASTGQVNEDSEARKPELVTEAAEKKESSENEMTAAKNEIAEEVPAQDEKSDIEEQQTEAEEKEGETEKNSDSSSEEDSGSEEDSDSDSEGGSQAEEEKKEKKIDIPNFMK